MTKGIIYTITVLVSLTAGLTLGEMFGPIGTVIAVPVGFMLGWLGGMAADTVKSRH